MGFVGALAGGFVAAKVAAGRSHPVTALAVLVLGLGLVMALTNALAEPPVAKTPEEISRMSVKERAAHAREPIWYSFSTPPIGALGIVLGGRIRRRQGRGDVM